MTFETSPVRYDKCFDCAFTAVAASSQGLIAAVSDHVDYINSTCIDRLNDPHFALARLTLLAEDKGPRG